VTVYSALRGASGFVPLGQRAALDRHAFFELRGKQIARLQKQQLVIEVTEGLLRLDVQIQLGTRAMALQRLFDPRQQVVATDQKTPPARRARRALRSKCP
jgi:hypothetical protein